MMITNLFHLDRASLPDCPGLALGPTPLLPGKFPVLDSLNLLDRRFRGRPQPVLLECQTNFVAHEANNTGTHEFPDEATEMSTGPPEIFSARIFGEWDSEKVGETPIFCNRYCVVSPLRPDFVPVLIVV
jgi:hypothetical protein